VDIDSRNPHGGGGEEKVLRNKHQGGRFIGCEQSGFSQTLKGKAGKKEWGIKPGQYVRTCEPGVIKLGGRGRGQFRTLRPRRMGRL